MFITTHRCLRISSVQEERVNSYLHVSTRPKLLKEVRPAAD